MTLPEAFRKVDANGQITIPIHLRRRLGIGEGTLLGISMKDGVIVMEKYDPTPACLVTGEKDIDNFVSGKLVLSKKAIKKIMPFIKQYLNNEEMEK